jgi:hypothetical protein
MARITMQSGTARSIISGTLPSFFAFPDRLPWHDVTGSATHPAAHDGPAIPSSRGAHTRTTHSIATVSATVNPSFRWVQVPARRTPISASTPCVRHSHQLGGRSHSRPIHWPPNRGGPPAVAGSTPPASAAARVVSRRPFVLWVSSAQRLIAEVA